MTDEPNPSHAPHHHNPEHDGHDHHHGHGHSHAHPVDGRNETRTLIAAALTGGFMLAEVIGGLLTGSLALLADAAHMLTDFAALLLAWGAFRLSRQPATSKRSYGYDRIQILAAFANGVTLSILVVWIVCEAIMRLFNPNEIQAEGMAVIAALGLLVNIAAFAVLHGADKDNLNIRGALAHVMGDLLGSVAAIIAAGVIWWTGWMPIDPLLSLLIAGLIGVSAWRLVRDAGRVLLEAAPDHIDPEALRADLMASTPGVLDVHHVHVWSLTPDRPMATLHARIEPDADAARIVLQLKARLAEEYRLTHATIEVETGPCADQTL
ncbi:cation diffusion facilitator family transporter [Oceanicaulis alexandrii]|uniref:cation diffusion facilitator family transporter n=1 Tax=Oceanicaulis alexandrii TaxID=153233 RepID=UPI003B50BE48